MNIRSYMSYVHFIKYVEWNIFKDYEQAHEISVHVQKPPIL